MADKNKDKEILEAELLTEVEDGVTIEHKSIDKNLTEMKGDSYHLKKLTIITIALIAICIISYSIGKSEEDKREEDCVEETKEDYGAAPSHQTYVTCTTSEKTSLQTFSETITPISFVSSLVFMFFLYLQFSSSLVDSQRQRQLENAERIRLGIENQAKKFEEEKDYLSAITAWRELNMEDEVIRVMKNQAKKFEEEKDYLSAITAWRELNMEDEAIRIMKNQAEKFEKHKNYSSAITVWRELNMEDEAIRVMKNQADELEKHKNYSSAITVWRELNMKDEAIRVMKNQAYEREKARDYEPAIHIWEKLGEIEEAARVRKLQAELGSVKLSQKVVHGDEVSQTEIKDSVVTKSNVGSGGKSKAEKIKEIKELLDSGAIDDDEFKQMKKEILGK